jgi:hypothetical protein
MLGVPFNGKLYHYPKISSAHATDAKLRRRLAASFLMGMRMETGIIEPF